MASSSSSSSSYYYHHHHHGNHPAQSTASRSSAAATAAASSVSASSRLSSSSHQHQHQLPFAAALQDQEHEQQPPILRWSNDAHSGGVGERLFAAHYSLNPTTTAGGSTNPDHPQRQQHQHQHQHHHHQQQLSSDYPYPASLSYKSTSYMDPSGRSVSAHHIHNNHNHSHNGSSSSSPPLSRGANHCYHHHAAAAPSVSDMVVPSLDYDASSVAESSVNTFKSGQGPTNRVLEEGHDGVLQVPSASPSSPHTTTAIIYDCAFSFLGCRYYAAAAPATASAEAEWKTHVLSHFHTHSPPRKVSCPLCDWGFEHASDGSRAWDVRMNHVAAHHRAGQRLSLSTDGAWVDSNLFRYLWQKRIISDAEYQDLSSGGALRGPRMATMGQQVEGRRGRREWAARRVVS